MILKINCTQCKHLGKSPSGEGFCNRILEYSLTPTQDIDDVWLGTIDFKSIMDSARIKIRHPETLLCARFEYKE